MVVRLTVALLILSGPAFACGPSLRDPLSDVKDIFDEREAELSPVLSVKAQPAGQCDPDELLGDDEIADVRDDLNIDDLLDQPPDTARPTEPSWHLATRDALMFKTWPADLDQGKLEHRQAMDLVERSIIPLERGFFRPNTKVTRIQLLDWLSQVEDWVRVGQSGLSLETKLTRAKACSPIVTLLRMGLVTQNRPLDGDQWVDRAFELRVLDGLERTWGTPPLADRPRLTASNEPDRAQVAVWLRAIAEDLCHSGRPPVVKVEARSLAHLTILLTLLEDPSPAVREMAHRMIADADAAVVATLLIGRKEAWFRDPVVLETLPETAVKLGLADGELAAGQFREVARIMRGLKDPSMDARFIKAAQDALSKIPQEKPLSTRLLNEMTGILVANKWTEQLDSLLQWGMPALDALIPYLEQEALDHHWSDRMPYSIEPGWDQRGLGVVAQLRALVKNPRIPAGTRASALDRLDRLGETITRDQARAMGSTPDNDADAARARLSRMALRMMDRQTQMAQSHRRTPAEDNEIAKLVQMVRTYQVYLAIALAVLALIALVHLLVLIPMLIMRVLRRLRQAFGLEGKAKELV